MFKFLFLAGVLIMSTSGHGAAKSVYGLSVKSLGSNEPRPLTFRLLLLPCSYGCGDRHLLNHIPLLKGISDI